MVRRGVRAGQARRLAIGVHFCTFARQLARIIACALACTFHPKFLERSQKKNRRLQNLVCRKRTPGDQRESGANKNSLFDVHFCTPAVCIFRTQNFWGERKKNKRIKKPRAPDDELRRASCRSSCSAPPRFFGKLACINARQLACTSAHQPYGGWGGGGGLRTGSLWDGRGDGSRGSRNGWKCGGTDFGGVVGGVVAAGMKRARLGRNGLWRGREV